MVRDPLRAALVLLAALLALAATGEEAGAQETEGGRTLYWRSLAVQARLDAEGRLHVTERQAMVFHGAWNGGERTFDLRTGQLLEIQGVTRTDPATGATRALVEGDVAEVDRWQREGRAVRWRSRRPEDPPFRSQEIVYTLSYTLANVLLPTADGYLLAHDFAFADRPGVIERFSVDLSLDPVWRAPGGFTGREEAAGLAPGRGWVMRVPLRYLGTGTPAAVSRGPAAPFRAAVAAALLLLPALLLGRFFRRERAAGRFDPLAVPEDVDEPWLRAELLRHPPELVGAIWDRSVGAPEVAALLARLVQEGKLASRVEPGDEPVLHLSLRAPRRAFADHERGLIDALFWDGRTETSTLEVRERYEGEGFDPAALIAPGIEARLDAAMPGQGRARKSWGAPFALLGSGVALLIAAAARDPRQLGAAVLLTLVILALGSLSLAAAAAYAKRAVRLAAPAGWMVALLCVLVLPLAAFAGGVMETGADGELGPLEFYHPTALLLLGVLVLVVGWVTLVLEVAHPFDLPERLAFRRRLALARGFFERELSRPAPRLRDEWYPYLLAFGLGPHVDRWFESFGAAGSRQRSGVVVADVGGSRSGGGGSGRWTGGGPTFGGGSGGGGGAGGAWSVAAASMAAGVSAPSSGGGGGGSASSGGGGGGGW